MQGKKKKQLQAKNAYINVKCASLQKKSSFRPFLGGVVFGTIAILLWNEYSLRQRSKSYPVIQDGSNPSIPDNL